VLPGAVMFGTLNKELNLTAKLAGAVSIKAINRRYVTDLSKRGVCRIVLPYRALARQQLCEGGPLQAWSANHPYGISSPPALRWR